MIEYFDSADAAFTADGSLLAFVLAIVARNLCFIQIGLPE